MRYSQRNTQRLRGLRAVMAVAALALAGACGDTRSDPITAAFGTDIGAAGSFAISPSAPAMQVGQTLQLTTNATTELGPLEWRSSSTGVASVSNTGLVTATGTGLATITATSTVDRTRTASIGIIVRTNTGTAPSGTGNGTP